MKLLPKAKSEAEKAANLPVKSSGSTAIRRGKRPAVETAATARVGGKTVEQHRREIIGSARKYIYPLAPTRRRIVVVSTSILLAAIIVFLIISGILLYKFQSTSTFIYRVTQVVPFPVAKADGQYVAYENYLFEVRHYVHYYEYREQEPVDFDTASGQNQLNHYKQEALNDVINLTYAKQLAKKNNITVSQDDVSRTLAVAKGRLGGNSQEFASVLNSFWGWSISDYRRELQQELLEQKVASVLDVGAHTEANSILVQLKSGADFGTLAAKYSDDSATKSNSGQYPELVNRDNTNLPPQIVAAAFELKSGQTSGVINTGYTLEIVKVLSASGSGLKLAHIQINLKPISTYINPLKAKNPPTYYIHLPKG